MILLRKINNYKIFSKNLLLIKKYSTTDKSVNFTSFDLEKPIIGRTDAEHLFLYSMKPDMPENPKLLKISMLGGPNVGKSTLMNRLMNRRISSSSSKINTTNKRITGVLTDRNSQLIFLDTPGIIPFHLKKKFKLTRSHILDPRSTLWESDLICVVQDCSDKYRRHKIDTEVLKCLYMHPEKESILILNKIDLVGQKKQIFELIAQLTDGQLNGIKFDIRDTRPVSLEKELEKIYLNTAKKLNLKLESSEEEKDAVKLLSELRECENKLFNCPEYLEMFDKETAIEEEGKSDEKSLLAQKLEEKRISLEKLTNAAETSDTIPYKSVNDITSQEFKKDLMETTDWHLYYKKLNKLDLLVRDRKAWQNFNQVFMISAKTNDGVDDLKRYLFSRAKPGNWQFSRNMVTDQMPKDIAMMCVREQMLEVLPGEVPYELDLEVQYWNIDEDDTLNVVVNIYPRAKKLKRDISSLLKGGGKYIKYIADNARQEMMNTFQCEVSLKLIAVCN